MLTIAPRVPSVGQAAPDFSLPSSTNTPVTLSTSRGANHVLLAFFPPSQRRENAEILAAIAELS